MTNFNKTLETILKKDLRFVDQDGDLLKSEVIDKAWKVDTKLIELLLSDKQVKAKFFSEIKGHWIFNVAFFVDFVQDKNFLNNSYTKFKNKIGLTIDGKYLNQRNEVALAWPYKDCVLEGGMSDEESKRDEIFFNEILAQDEIDRLFDPKVLTNFKRYTQDGEQPVAEIKKDENGNVKDNLIIKGNNLLAMHCLKKRFAGRVKLIYIDPPYNTKNDGFKYNDRFSHSTWLTFMKNRLEVAKELLREDGIIFVQCDDNEQAYLKVLMDEIFGKELLLSIHHIQVRYGNKSLNERKDFQELLEYVLIYAKSNIRIDFNKPSEEYSLDKFNLQITHSEKPSKTVKENGREVDIWYPNSFTIKKEEQGSVKLFKETWISGSILTGTGHGKMYTKVINKRRKEDGDGCLYRIHGIGEDGLGYRYYTNPNDPRSQRGKMYTKVPTKILEQIKNGTARKENPIINFYDYSADFGNIRHEGGVPFNAGKKPVKMLKQFINYIKEKEFIVLDFFSGSGTTAHAVLELNKEDGGNRKFILVEQMDYIETVTVPRVQKVMEQQGSGEFVYLELKTYNQDFIDRIQKTKTTKNLEKIWEEMKEKSFLNWNVDFRNADLAFEEWKKLDLEKQKRALVMLLNKNQLYVNFSEMDDKDMECSEEEKKLSKSFYGL